MKWRQLLTIYVLPCLLALASLNAQGQQVRTVTGRVTNAKDGSPISGASVQVKGANEGAVTDANGNFSIRIPRTAKTLVISSVGFNNQEVPVSAFAQAGFSVRMAVAATELNDVVVIGYGSIRKKDLTGAVSSVDAKDFQKGAITSPDQLIQGKIAGVSVTPNNGEPGSASTIRIRGLTSLFSNNDPLIVLDGVELPPLGTGVAGLASLWDIINPDDIANMTVLKDAASEAIYGSRASAGVILITTKRPEGGKRPQFNFNTAFTVGTVAKEISVLSAAQYRNFITTTPADSPGVKLLGSANTNWQKQIYQTAITTTNNLSMTGRAKWLPYRLSVGFLDQTGVLKTDQLQRGSGAVHLTPHLLNNRLNVELNLTGSITQSRFANQGAIGDAIAFDPTQPVYTNNKSKYGGYFEWTNPATGDLIPLATRNPVAYLEQFNSMGYAEAGIGNLKLDYNLPWIDGLHAIYNIGFTETEGHGFQHVPAYAAQDLNNSPGPGYSANYRSTTAYTFNTASLNYVKDIKAIKSNINVLATYEYNNTLQTQYSYPEYDAEKDTISGTAPLYPRSYLENTLISYIGRFIYTFDNKYILQASIRDDGSSKFGPTYRWGTFPTIAGSWIISQEKFLRNTSWLTNLKVRASYGVTGNQDGIQDYGYLPIYSFGGNASRIQFGNNYFTEYVPAPYIAGLKWEQTASSNVGVDFGLFNNRLTGSFDYYYKKISNLFNYTFIPAGTNFTNEDTINVGDMTDRGFEINLNVIPIRTKDLEWDVNFNLAYNKNLITKLVNNSKDSTFYGDETGGIAGATGQSIQINTVGYSPDAFFVLQQVYGKNGKPLEGVYVDRNRDGQITEPDDQYRYHSPFAPVIIGFSTSVSYQKWTFSLVARANIGNYVYNNVDAGEGVSKYMYQSAGYLTNAVTDVLNTGFYNNQFQSDYYVKNASFLKIDNIGVNYDVGKIWTKTDLRLSGNVQNAFIITKYDGIDPEVYGGIDNNQYPRPRNFTVGASLNF